MGILFRVTIHMVHAMHNPITKSTEIVGALEDPGKNKKYFFGKGAHGERLVRCIPVEEESLKEEGEIPVC